MSIIVKLLNYLKGLFKREEGYHSQGIFADDELDGLYHRCSHCSKKIYLGETYVTHGYNYDEPHLNKPFCCTDCVLNYYKALEGDDDAKESNDTKHD